MNDAEWGTHLDPFHADFPVHLYPEGDDALTVTYWIYDDECNPIGLGSRRYDESTSTWIDIRP